MATGDYLGDLREVDHMLESGPGRRILQAAVDTLLDGAPPELAVDMRVQLPDVLKGSTKPYNAEAPATVDAFLERFRKRAHLSGEDVLHDAQVAVALVADMLDAELVADLRASFPSRFGLLFERSSHEHGSSP